MPSRSTNIRILLLLSVILICSIALLVVAAFVSVYYGWNYGGFLAAEVSFCVSFVFCLDVHHIFCLFLPFQCIMLFFRALHGVVRYGAHLYDNTNQHSTWEERTSFIYYTELMFELLILLTDFVHHIHMLVEKLVCLRNIFREFFKILRFVSRFGAIFS